MSGDVPPPGGHDESSPRRDPAFEETRALPGEPQEPERPAPAAGTQYQLGSVLGQGGMATVYEAYDAALDRPVAVKVLKPALGQDPEFRARFLHEARLLGQMGHPGAVPVFAAGELPGHGRYYAMKKVSGQTLEALLKPLRERDRVDPAERARLVEIFERVCQTVAYAHAQGIVHRDLKPANIMVDEFGVVLVLDWGLAKRLDRPAADPGIQATQAGVVRGTPAYMSPEQARGVPQAIDFRTDVFALGIILYEILTGQPPFSGGTHAQVLDEIVHREPPDPRQVSRRASRALAAICMKALSKDPALRYPSAKALAEDVRLARDYLPCSAYRPGPLERLGGWVWRPTTLAASLGAALLLGLLLGGAAWNRHATDSVRSAERRERDRLLQELEATRERERLHQAMLAVRKAVGAVRGFDRKLLDLEEAKRQLDPRDAARLRQLAREIEELRTARQMGVMAIRQAVARMVAGQRLGADTALDTEVLPFVRELCLEEIARLAEHGELYEAHYLLWHYRTRVRLGWTEAELGELARLERQVEAKFREKHGADVPLPDWEALSPESLAPPPE